MTRARVSRDKKRDVRALRKYTVERRNYTFDGENPSVEAKRLAGHAQGGSRDLFPPPFPRLLHQEKDNAQKRPDRTTNVINNNKAAR